MIAITPGADFRKVEALEELLALEALEVEAGQREVEPDSKKFIDHHVVASFSGHRLGRRRHHGRGRRSGNSAATPGIGQLEAELQEELFRLPEIDEKCEMRIEKKSNSLVPMGPESLLRLVHLP